MPTPQLWLSEFQVNTGTADIEAATNAKSTGLTNGNFIVTWVEDGTGGVASEFGQDIVAQIYDPLGNPIGSSFRVNSQFTSGDEGAYDISATSDGGYELYYRSVDAAGSHRLINERYDADGVLVSTFDTGTAPTSL